MPNDTLLTKLKKQFPGIKFIKGQTFYWSPINQAVFFNADKLSSNDGQWALLHEVAHGALGHSSYENDMALLLCEVAAWQQALELAQDYDVVIDKDHVEDCLDTYRDWLYARSSCPLCELNSLQVSSQKYQCLNCQNTWKVSPSRFCRPYRMQKRHQKTSPGTGQAMFR